MGIVSLIFYLMLATLFTHELDAMTQSEWRLLYVLRDMPPADGAFWFVVVHVPFFAVLIWLTHAQSQSLRYNARNALAVFMIIHAGLHYHLRNDPLNTFNSPLSLTLIYAGAALGVLYLLTQALANRQVAVKGPE